MVFFVYNIPSGDSTGSHNVRITGYVNKVLEKLAHLKIVNKTFTYENRIIIPFKVCFKMKVSKQIRWPLFTLD